MLAFTLPENLFHTFWSPEEDVLSCPGSPAVQRNALKQYDDHSLEKKRRKGVHWRFRLSTLKWLFVLFTAYQIVYGTYHNVVYCLKDVQLLDGLPSSIHDFRYLFVATTLNFSRQSHWLLLFHSVFGGIYLLSCFYQTSMVRSLLSPSESSTFLGMSGTKLHQRVGKICLFSSLMASSSAWILSFRALYGTETIYLLGTSLWVYTTLITYYRAKQNQWISHSRWALTLQELGIMFTTTRIYAPLFLMLGFSTPDSYHWGVWGAGFTALMMLIYNEKSRQDHLLFIRRREAARISSSQTQDSNSLQLHSSELIPVGQSPVGILLAKSFVVILLLFVFVGAPLLYHNQWMDYQLKYSVQNYLLVAEAFTLTGFMASSIAVHCTSPQK